MSIATAQRALSRRAAFFGALLVAVALAAAFPACTLGEEASQPSEAAAAQLDSGRHHSCAILTATDVRCWGFAGEGQLGYGGTQAIGDDETAGAAGPVDLGPGGSATSISVGHFHTCALLEDRSVRCWGFGQNGRLGYGSRENVGDNETPGSLPSGVNVGAPAVAISAGGSHSCALLSGGTVRCWGYGEYGALGYGGEVNVPESPARPSDIGDDEAPTVVGPVSFGAGRTVVAISAGGAHTCALLNGGEVRCWGDGASGQLGYGSARSVSDPSTVGAVDLAPGRAAVAISAGDVHTCAVLDNGAVRCWGAGLDGRLGYGNQDMIGDNETPSSIPPVDLGGRNAVAISAGDNHTCARLEDRTLRCWGLARTGQLGYGNTSKIGDDETPAALGAVDLGPGRTALAISAGSQHTCARLAGPSVTVSCWGYAGNGRLGYCNERNVGDDERPASVGPVPFALAVRAPSNAYPGCARVAAGGHTTPRQPAVRAPSVATQSPLEAEAARTRAYRDCLSNAAGHARREVTRARRGSRRLRALLRRHIKRHRLRKRRACAKRHGRTPGRATGLTARAGSGSSVVLTFQAPGSDGRRPPAARSYLVKQSRRPIRGRRAFRRAQTLCKGRCRFPSVTQVGGEVTLTVRDLRPRTTYYYAVAARDNVSGRLGPRTRAVRARTH